MTESNRLSPNERYERDPLFHHLVDMLEHAISQCEYTPTEIREAAMLAALRWELHNTRRSFISYGTEFKILPRLFTPGAKAWELFHRAWTKAVGESGYNKDEWLRMERALTEAATELEPTS